MSITYGSYVPGDTAVLEKIIPTYRIIFGDPPWNEWRRCDQCPQQWGRAEWQSRLADGGSAERCACGGSIVDFWPTEQVRADLTHELTADASCWLAYDEGRVIGFCWGYPITIGELETKLGLTFNAELKSRYRLFSQRRVAYQDDLGVLAEYRRRGIAKRLVALRNIDFLATGLDEYFVRTKKVPPSVTYRWYLQNEEYREIAEYPAPDGRVILARGLVERPEGGYIFGNCDH